MKIVIATAVYYPMINGVAMFSHNLAVGLARRGHEVVVICPSQTGRSYARTVEGVRVEHLKSVNAKIYPDQIHKAEAGKKIFGVTLPFAWYKHGFRVSVFPQREIKRILGRVMPDVVHVQVSDPIGLSVVGYARRHGIPVVTTEHNQPEVLTEPLRMPRVVRKGANMMLAAYFRNRQSKSDFVTMPTERAIANLLERGKEFPVPVAAVSNGVDLRAFRPGTAKKEFYAKYHLPQGAPMALYVGRLDPEKKVERVIEAFFAAQARIPEARLVIAGDGVDKNRLEKMVHERGLTQVVLFLGRVVPPELYEVYRAGDVFVTASPIETQGIVLIEAAASGLPLIAADKGAVSEICVNGENGVLVADGDVRAIAEALVRLLSDKKLRQEYGTRSIELAQEHDMERTLDKFEEIYRRVVARRDAKK